MLRLARRLSFLLTLGLVLGSCMESSVPTVDNPAWRYVTQRQQDADILLVYLKSLRVFPRDPSAAAPQQTVTADWIREIRQHARFLHDIPPPAGLEDLDAVYAATDRDVQHALDLYEQGSPETHEALGGAIIELANAQQTTGNLRAAMLDGQSPPFHILTPTP